MADFSAGPLAALGDVRFGAAGLPGNRAAMDPTQQPTGLQKCEVLAHALRADAETICQAGTFDTSGLVEQSEHLGVPLVGEPRARGHGSPS